MIELGIGVRLEQLVTGYSKGKILIRSVYEGGASDEFDCGSLIVVGNRVGDDELYRELAARTDLQSVQAIGDCRAPGAIVHAVYSGHEYARLLGSDEPTRPVLRERPQLL